MKTYIFTFGIGQQHERTAARIKAPTQALAREKMVEEFGLEWAFEYTEDDYLYGCELMGLEPYPVKFEYDVTV